MGTTTELMKEWLEIATVIVHLGGAETPHEKRAFAAALAAMDSFNRKHPQVAIEVMNRSKASATDVTLKIERD